MRPGACLGLHRTSELCKRIHRAGRIAGHLLLVSICGTTLELAPRGYGPRNAALCCVRLIRARRQIPCRRTSVGRRARDCSAIVPHERDGEQDGEASGGDEEVADRPHGPAGYAAVSFVHLTLSEWICRVVRTCCGTRGVKDVLSASAENKPSGISADVDVLIQGAGRDLPVVVDAREYCVHSARREMQLRRRDCEREPAWRVATSES